nr:undecaprenyl-diphosphatase [Candidatus Cloacimonadota bacterium]
MTFFQSIFLGIIQGLTEFIPVSSSGHLVLAQYFFGIGGTEDITFEVFVHLGTLVAVFIYFYRQILDLVVSLFSWKPNLDAERHRNNRSMILYLAVATLATGVIYMIFKSFFEDAYGRPLLVSIMLLITGVMIFLSDFVKDTHIPASNIGIVKSFFIGIAQACAIIPGISRSGATITASLFCKVRRKDAAHFSFLLSIPAILAANVSELPALLSLDVSQLYIYLAGFLASFIAGYLVISILIRLIQSSSLKYFAYYVWAVAGISILVILIR